MDSELCRQVVEDPGQYADGMLKEAAEQEGVSGEERDRLYRELLERPPIRREVALWLMDLQRCLEQRIEEASRPWWRRAWEALRG